ncbi:TPA: hypothetical protein L6B63_17565, partial [Pseudomonas aeruginosa]|nr:hypothetical protein [Pseudomonas aeruginosa]
AVIRHFGWVSADDAVGVMRPTELLGLRAVRGVERITAERLSAISAGYRRMTPTASCALRSYRDFALSVA